MFSESYIGLVEPNPIDALVLELLVVRNLGSHNFILQELLLIIIEVSNAQLDTDYYCPFKVNNAVGSLPIKIASLSLTNSITGVTELIEDITVGTVIDPGTSATGKVHIYLTTDAMVGEDIPVTLEVTVERWNE